MAQTWPHYVPGGLSRAAYAAAIRDAGPPTKDVYVNRQRVPARSTPPRKPAAVPWWMLGPAALQKQAQEQANAYYKPQLDELHHQQLEAKNQAAANLRAVQKLIEVVSAAAGGLDDNVQAAYAHAAGADYGPSDFAGRTQDAYRQEGQAYSGLGDIYKAQAGLAGQAQFLNTVQDSDKIARDLLGEILKVQGEIPGTAQDIYKELVSGQEKYKSAQQKAYDQQYDRQYRMAKDTVTNLNKGPWLYTIGVGKDGLPDVILVRDKKGNPISTTGMSDYQVASLAARAEDSKARAATNAAKPPPQRKNPDGSYSIYQPGIGWVKDPSYNPSKPPKKPGKTPTPRTAMGKWNALTQNERDTRRQEAFDKIDAAKQSGWRYADGSTLTPAELRAHVAQFDYTTKTGKKRPLTVADLPSLTEEELADVELTGSAPVSAQQTYLFLVRNLGIPARIARDWVATAYKGFGSDYFPGKK